MIAYQEFLDEAMLGIVRKVLLQLQTTGIDDERGFYISFLTDYPGVTLSNAVRARHDSEITIVLQYQYRNLQVLEDKFSVNLAFGGVPETIVVPFNALTSFVDPVANFSLQFNRDFILDDLNDNALRVFDKEEVLPTKKKVTEEKSQKKKTKGQVVSFEQFRKKK